MARRTGLEPQAEIRFKEPLAPFQVLVIQLDEGNTAIDGQALKAWSLRFTTGT